jgi:cytochrome oxidase Cu insertion factor (SCO1/SenC/PrrC family)
MNRLLFLLAVVLFASGTVQAQTPPRERINVQKLGPQVGQKVPDFTLKDQDGKLRDLNSIMGPKGAMLVFIRSADW